MPVRSSARRLLRVAGIWIVCAVPLLLSAAETQKLWQGADYGMSVDQVLQAVTGTHKNDSPSPLSSGAADLLHGEEVEIASYKFLPKFYFGTRGLELVRLSLVGAKSVAEANLAFDSVTAALRVRYGHEVSSQVDALSRKIDFLSGGTNITIIVLTMVVPLVNIDYERRLAQDASKL